MKLTDTHLFFSRSYLSNWYQSPFTVEGVSFLCVEQGMMWMKAALFGDIKTRDLILAEDRPWRQKQLGRIVKGFDSAVWDKNKEEIVFACCFAKFDQNPDLKEKLLGTTPLIIVEASPWDKVWGVGLAEDDPLVVDPVNWTGQNLLGKALMRARDRLSA